MRLLFKKKAYIRARPLFNNHMVLLHYETSKIWSHRPFNLCPKVRSEYVYMYSQEDLTFI